MDNLFSYEDEFDHSFGISLSSPTTSEYSKSSDIDEEEIIDFGSSGFGHPVGTGIYSNSSQQFLTHPFHGAVHATTNSHERSYSQQNSDDSSLDYVIDFDGDSEEDMSHTIKPVDGRCGPAYSYARELPRIYNLPLENIHPHYSASLSPLEEPRTSLSSRHYPHSSQLRESTAPAALSGRHMDDYVFHALSQPHYFATQQQHHNSASHHITHTDRRRHATTFPHDVSRPGHAYSLTDAAMSDTVAMAEDTAEDAEAHDADVIDAGTEAMEAVIDFSEDVRAHRANGGVLAPRHMHSISDPYHMDGPLHAQYSHHYIRDDGFSRQLPPENPISLNLFSQSTHSNQVHPRSLRSRPLLLRSRGAAARAGTRNAHGLTGTDTVLGCGATITATSTKSACNAEVAATDAATAEGARTATRAATLSTSATVPGANEAMGGTPALLLRAAAEAAAAGARSEGSSQGHGNTARVYNSPTPASRELTATHPRPHTYASAHSHSCIHMRTPTWRDSVQLWAPSTPADVFTVRERAQALAALLATAVADDGGELGDGGGDMCGERGREGADAGTGACLGVGVNASMGVQVDGAPVQPKTPDARAGLGVVDGGTGMGTGRSDAAGVNMGVISSGTITSATEQVLRGGSEGTAPLPCGAAVTAPSLRVRVRYIPLQAAAYLCPRRKCYVYRPVCARHVAQAEGRRAATREARRRAREEEKERAAEEHAREKATLGRQRRRRRGRAGGEKESVQGEAGKPSNIEGGNMGTQGRCVAANGSGWAEGDVGQTGCGEQDGTSKKRKQLRPRAATAVVEASAQAVPGRRRGRTRKALQSQEGAQSQGSATRTRQEQLAASVCEGDVDLNVGGRAGKAMAAEVEGANVVVGGNARTGERKEGEGGGATDEEDMYVCVGGWEDVPAPWPLNHTATHSYGDSHLLYGDEAAGEDGGKEEGGSTASASTPAIAPDAASETLYDALIATQRGPVDIPRPATSALAPLACIPCVARGDNGRSAMLEATGIGNLTASAPDASHGATSRNTRAGARLEEDEQSQPMRCHMRAASVSLPPRTHTRAKALARVLSVLATLLHAHRQEGHSSKRDLYYANTSLFGTQRASDASLLLLQSLLHAPRHALGVSAGGRGECEGAVVVEVRECLRVWRETEVIIANGENPLLNPGNAAEEETSSAGLAGVDGTCVDVLRLCRRAGWGATCTAAERDEAVPRNHTNHDLSTATQADTSSGAHISALEDYHDTTAARTRVAAIVSSPADSQKPRGGSLDAVESCSQPALCQGVCACVCDSAPTRTRECLFEHYTPAGSFDFAFARHIPDINAQRHLRPAARTEVIEYVGAAALVGDDVVAGGCGLIVHAMQDPGQRQLVHAEADRQYTTSTDEDRHTSTHQRAYVRVCGYYLEHAIEHRVRCRAQWVLVVEKDTVFRQLVGGTAATYLPQNTAAKALQESDVHGKVRGNPKMTFSQRYGCLVVTGGGYPGVQTRQFLRELALGGAKIVCLVDGDPHGVAICLAYLFGSPNQCLDCPAHLPLRWIGVTPRELWRDDDRVSAHVCWGDETADDRARGGVGDAAGGAPRVSGARGIHSAVHDVNEEDGDDENNSDAESISTHSHNPCNIPNNECLPQLVSSSPQRSRPQLDVSVRRRMCLPLTLRDRRTARALLRWLDTGERRGLDAAVGAGGADNDGGDDNEDDVDEEEEEEDVNGDGDGTGEDEAEEGGLDVSPMDRGPRHWSRTAAKLSSELKYMLRHNCKCEIEAVSALGPHALERYVVSKAGRFIKDLRIPSYSR